MHRRRGRGVGEQRHFERARPIIRPRAYHRRRRFGRTLALPPAVVIDRRRCARDRCSLPPHACASGRRFALQACAPTTPTGDRPWASWSSQLYSPRGPSRRKDARGGARSFRAAGLPKAFTSNEYDGMMRHFLLRLLRVIPTKTATGVVSASSLLGSARSPPDVDHR
jgi:hypothetical protein